MKIVKIIEKTIPFGSIISNSYINFKNMTGSVIAIVTDVMKRGKPIVGYGFNSIGRYAATSTLRDRMIPKLLFVDSKLILSNDGRNFDPFKINDILKMNEKPGGHGERAHAIGAIDMAIWDTISKIEDKPLYKLLSERFNNGDYDKKVFTYAAGGYYYEGNNLENLKNELKSYLDMGFDCIKMKIGGTGLYTDLKRIESALSVVDGVGARLMVDANGRFDLKKSLEYASEIEKFKLKWYEEPLDPLDFSNHAALCEYYKCSIATGENLFSYQDLRNLIRHGGLRTDKDYIQMDVSLSYGLVEYLKVLRFLKDNGWSTRNCIPHGGNQFNLHVVSGLKLGGNECYPKVFQPLGGFADNIAVTDGYARCLDIPGIGFEAKSNLWNILKTIA